jgi:Mce-associated membrane protein
LTVTEGTIVDDVVEETEPQSEDVPEGIEPSVAPEADERPVRDDQPHRTRRRGTVVGVAAAVVLIGLVAALVISRVQLSHADALDAQRPTVVAVAKNDAGDVASYSYQHLQQDFGRVEAESTPGFRRNFVASSRSLSKVLTQYHATAKAKVLDAGIASLTSSRAVVILFVDQTVSNTAQGSGPSTDDSRVQVTLVQSDGRWLLAGLKLL